MTVLGINMSITLRKKLGLELTWWGDSNFDLTENLLRLYILVLLELYKNKQMLFGTIVHIMKKNELDKIQSEAARTVSGATKRVSLHALYEEVGWESLEERHRKHKLLLLYKMFNKMSPLYLCSLIPPTVDTQSSYNLGNAHTIRTVHSRTTQYLTLFCLRPSESGKLYPLMCEILILLSVLNANWTQI